MSNSVCLYRETILGKTLIRSVGTMNNNLRLSIKAFTKMMGAPFFPNICVACDYSVKALKQKVLKKV